MAYPCMSTILRWDLVAKRLGRSDRNKVAQTYSPGDPHYSAIDRHREPPCCKTLLHRALDCVTQTGCMGGFLSVH